LKLIPQTVTGVVTDRKIMIKNEEDDGETNGDIHWFIVTLRDNLPIEGFIKNKFLIKFEDGIVSLKYDEDMPAYMLAIPDEEKISENIISLNDFKVLGSVCINRLS
jgi:predicted acyltransferase (DUF342 family)